MKAKPKQKSSVVSEIAADPLGDRWSLLILRNMLLRGHRSFKELLGSGDGIATNILANRLRKLLTHGIIVVKRDSSDRRKLVYSPTAKGMDLMPILIAMVSWTARHGGPTPGPATRSSHRMIRHGAIRLLSRATRT